MKLGIDFGTTRIVVAAADRGNYPVILFEDPDGVSREWFPPLAASRGSERVYGWQAWQAQSIPGWTVVRSLKRLLDDAGPYTLVRIGESTVSILQVLEEMALALRQALIERSSMPYKKGESLEIILGVPANANGNQRFLTVEPFQRAGFSVLGLLNEPSAAGIEYGHRNRGVSAAQTVLVYDLGGGTFDASLVSLEESVQTVIASEGIQEIGGDDFDILLAELALEEAKIDPAELTQAELFLLHEECRGRKESLHPNTRRIVIELGAVREEWGDVSVAAATYYERCRPLVERTIAATERLITGHVDALYVTGGGSELPAVSRFLREVFGRRVKRSAYTRSATAIGLSIQADSLAAYTLREKFTRHFGVWREMEGGHEVCLDVLFPKGTSLPGPGDPLVEITRSYYPVHNIGHFRYLECSHLTPDGRPSGDIAVWDEILFPFDPALSEAEDLRGMLVAHTPRDELQVVQERYLCNAAGSVEVEISNETAGITRKYRLGRWSASSEPVVPGRKRRSRAGAH